MKTKTLALRIGLGYALMLLLLATTLLLTMLNVRGISRSSELLANQREPTAHASQQLRTGISVVTSELTKWLVTSDGQYRSLRQQAWPTTIKEPLSAMEQLSLNWTNPANVGRLELLKPLIIELEILHAEIETLAVTNRDTAISLFQEKSIPLTLEISDLLDQMTTNQRELLKQEVNDVSQQVTLLSQIAWILLGAGFLLGSTLLIFVTRSITRPVAHAVTVAENISQGDLESPVNVGGSHELVILGDALTHMRDSIRRKTQENERFIWLSTGQHQLNEGLRGDKSPEQLAKSIVTIMAGYTGASIGSLYLMDENRNSLSMAATYAFSSGRIKNRFQMGEGLIGQAAFDSTPIALSNIDEGYASVKSSLLDIPPHSIYVCPFRFEGAVLGVLELGKCSPFNDMEYEFIDASMEDIGIALNSACSRMRIQSLLEETQQQSEELQHQQQELEQSNQELEEKTQSLREQQEELETTNQELEEQSQLIAEKNQRLEEARESIEVKARQLEISSKYKSEFLANMSHELRTPLNSLLILSNDLANNDNGNLDAEQVESAEVISKSGRDLLKLINDILDLSKVEAGRLDVNITAVPVSEFTNDILRNFRRLAQEKCIELKTIIDPALPDMLMTDRQRLEQILNNLISNALKFTHQGAVTITLRLDPVDYIAIAVSDTGIGIPQDKQDTIFEAFVQADGGTSRKYGGTGLGLSISRELAKLLDGRIIVESEPGKGSTFTLLMPLSVERQTLTQDCLTEKNISQKNIDSPEKNQFINYPALTDQRNDIDGHDNVILLVEDDHSFARILAAQASHKGFKHLHAASGEDALILAAQYLPDAIILDMELPGMGGHLVLKELKSNPELRHIPVHIISGSESTRHQLKSGAVEYLKKPVSKKQLDDAFGRIETFIDRKVKNLLIVEDDGVMRKAIVKLIGNGDVQCLEASTAREALDFCRKNVVDCMVLDIGLPDMSGFEMIKLLKQDGKIPPIIVHTGRDLSKEENDELQQCTESIIVKGERSEDRLLDETALFLHRTVKNLPEAKKTVITQLYDREEQLRGKRVLLVDDDMRNVFALSKVLKNKGMEVLKAENGRSALDRLTSEPDMDFVLMDIMMPEMDGYECMQQIRKRKEFSGLPIVALTAKAMKEDRQKCIDAGANDYITKPVDVDRLVSLMRIWIKK